MYYNYILQRKFKKPIITYWCTCSMYKAYVTILGIKQLYIKSHQQLLTFTSFINNVYNLTSSTLHILVLLVSFFLANFYRKK